VPRRMAKIAIIETGGKQYLVEKDSVISIEKAPSQGGKISFDKVLLVDDGSTISVGAPHVSSAKVEGEVIQEGRAPKVTVIRYRQKSRYFKKKGHRQAFTRVKITTV